MKKKRDTGRKIKSSIGTADLNLNKHENREGRLGLLREIKRSSGYKGEKQDSLASIRSNITTPVNKEGKEGKENITITNRKETRKRRKGKME
ncbi:hypothetical protein O3P69_018873 [Scylla paramamosain]|uniref:Uncharacterized protein n=1 Tax=Scylla paramamosain TaxID=85552 RepID=A0AAW0SS57_SCYPA